MLPKVRVATIDLDRPSPFHRVRQRGTEQAFCNLKYSVRALIEGLKRWRADAYRRRLVRGFHDLSYTTMWASLHLTPSVATNGLGRLFPATAGTLLAATSLSALRCSRGPYTLKSISGI